MPAPPASPYAEGSPSALIGSAMPRRADSAADRRLCAPPSEVEASLSPSPRRFPDHSIPGVREGKRGSRDEGDWTHGTSDGRPHSVGILGGNTRGAGSNPGPSIGANLAPLSAQYHVPSRPHEQPREEQQPDQHLDTLLLRVGALRVRRRSLCHRAPSSLRVSERLERVVNKW